jgi:hypothetical protein
MGRLGEAPMTYETIKTTTVGIVKYAKIGDLTADELTGAVIDKRVKVVDPVSREISYISNYDLFNIMAENNAAAPFSIEKRAQNGIDLYKVEYSIKNNGKVDRVTGLLAIPVGIEAKKMPLLSWQHGTTFTANESPSGVMKNDELQSKPPGSILEGQIRSTETLFNLARFAGNGYIMAAADYNGLGDSMTPQYYAIDKPTTKATTGMLEASRAIVNKLGLESTKLFLNGWSQGAVNTLFLEKYLQTEGAPPTKTAHSSTFSSLSNTANYWFNEFAGTPPWLTSCIPMILGSYQEYYGIKGLMASAIKPQYLQISKKIYRGEVNWDQVGAPASPDAGLLGLPTTGKQMLKSKFRKDIQEGRGEFFRRIKENDPLTQTFNHPSQFYGGGEDTAIKAGYSVDKPVEYLSPLATGVWVGEGATHRSTFLASLYGSALNPVNDIFTWFAEP